MHSDVRVSRGEKFSKIFKVEEIFDRESRVNVDRFARDVDRTAAPISLGLLEFFADSWKQQGPSDGTRAVPVPRQRLTRQR